ncbi:MAG: PepSY-like domain-containing protein [Odoribacter sp.]
MKIRLLILGLLFATGACIVACSEDDDNGGTNGVHIGNKEKALLSKYPQAENFQWKKSKDQKYDIATFILSKVPSKAAVTPTDTVNVWFGENEKMRLIDEEIAFEALPEAVKSKFAKTNSILDKSLYSDVKQWEMDDVYKLERDGVVSYKIEMENIATEKEYDLYYDALGILIKEVEDMDEEEDEAPLEIPEDIKNWVTKNYAGAEILDFEMEEENGVKLYELDLKQGKLIIEIELSADLIATEEYNYPTPEALPAEILAKLKEVIAKQAVYALTDIDDIEMTKENGSEIYSIEFEKGKVECSLSIIKDSKNQITTEGMLPETEE